MTCTALNLLLKNSAFKLRLTFKDLSSEMRLPSAVLAGMRTIESFPSFGELQDLDGPGPHLGMLYQARLLMVPCMYFRTSLMIKCNIFVPLIDARMHS